MAKSDVDKVTEDTIAKGGILVKLYFDMRHTERDKLQPLMTDLINERLLKEPGVVYCYGTIEEPLEKDGIFITSAVVSLLMENYLPLVGIAFRYAPAGVEVIKPTRDMVLRPTDLQRILMEISDVSITYSKYILEKVLTDEDKDAMGKHLDSRADLGKKMIEKKPDK